MARVVGWSFAAGVLVGGSLVLRSGEIAPAMFALGMWVFVVAALCAFASEAK